MTKRDTQLDDQEVLELLSKAEEQYNYHDRITRLIRLVAENDEAPIHSYSSSGLIINSDDTAKNGLLG